MARIDYSEEEDYPGQFNLWQANCQRSLKGRSGQAALQELVQALEALPSKRLQAHIVACDGDVCAVGAVLLLRKSQEVGSIDAAQSALETELGPAEDQAFHETAELGESLGMPRLVAWKIVAMNDVETDGRYEWAQGPNPQPHRGYTGDYYRAGYQVWVPCSPEQRYERVLSWAKSQLASGRPQ